MSTKIEFTKFQEKVVMEKLSLRLNWKETLLTEDHMT